jgi:hypothetical protein
MAENFLVLWSGGFGAGGSLGSSETREPFLATLADLKRMVTLLPEADLLAIWSAVMDEVLFGRPGRNLRLVPTVGRTPAQPPPGPLWELMGFLRRMVHELDEEAVRLLRYWCSVRVSPG